MAQGARARQSAIHIRCHPSRTRRSVPPTLAPSGHVACLAVKPAGKPDAGKRHVRFDERGWETGRWPSGPQATAPILDSTGLTPNALTNVLLKWLSAQRARLEVRS